MSKRMYTDAELVCGAALVWIVATLVAAAFVALRYV